MGGLKSFHRLVCQLTGKQSSLPIGHDAMAMAAAVNFSTGVSITNARKNIKPEFLSLDIVLLSKKFFLGGGKLKGLGGKLLPRTPQ